MSHLLDRIDSPKDVKGLDTSSLNRLAAEIREKIVETVSRNGGHLGPNLGAVEICLAVHSVIDSPHDKVIWDVGHQAYPHKLITGRRDEFHTLRTYGGISGFPRLSESEHDVFGTAHAGTSISAALGYALARDRLGGDNAVIAVTGDGAMTAGMAFEALNHAGDLGTGLVVILNDNEMSIARNVGALSEYLTRLRTDPTLDRARNDVEALLSKIPAIGAPFVKAAERMKDSVIRMLVPGRFFEELGFSYYGPIDGHNIPLLQRVLRDAISKRRPVVIHAITQKGRGYKPAERDPGKLHAMRPISVAKPGETQRPSPPSYSHVFADALIEQARDDERIVAITAAMPDGTGLDRFEKVFPDRMIDVGIAEQHAVTLAGGLALGGLKPVVGIYSTFLQRGYDQVMHDISLQNLDVTFGVDRAGLVGDDGPTHHGCFDIPYLRTLPNVVLMAPKDEVELRDMLKTALDHPGPAFVRYPRGNGQGISVERPAQALELGRGEELRSGHHVAFLALGPWVYTALEAANELQKKGIEAAVWNPRFVKPLDRDMILSVANQVGGIITVEEGALAGGFGSAVLECLADAEVTGVPVRRIGIPDRYVEHGALPLLYKEVGLSVENLVTTAESVVRSAAERRLRAE